MIDLEHFAEIHFGSITYPVSGTFGPRWQRDWQLVLLHSGSVRIQIDDRQQLLEPGEVCLLEPGHREFYQFSQSSQNWHRWISLRLKTNDPGPAWETPAMPPKMRITTGMNQLMDNLMQLRHTGLADNHPSMLLIGMAAIELFRSASVPTGEPGLRHPALDHVMTYIRLNYADKIELADLAQVAGLSREHLIRLCRQYYQMTPMQILWDYRLKQGLDLLNGSGLTVNTIAERCGFAAACHFARMIRRRTGQTPTQIRRQALRIE